MDKKNLFVLPGELTISRQPAIISTMLGSSVAICIYNKSANISGMNHFILPNKGDDPVKTKYADFSTAKLVTMLKKFDANSANFVAKIYGGSEGSEHLSSATEGIGKQNIDAAMKLMNFYSIKVVKREIGGNNNRKIFFDTTTGEVNVRVLEKSEKNIELGKKKTELAGRKIRVLVVDDSSTVRKIIISAISSDPKIEVVGEAEDPYHAREKILELDPDVITLDIIMPKMDGLTFLKKLMLHMPKPVIVISSVAQKGSKQRERAKAIGAFDILDKEELNLYKGAGQTASVLLPKIKAAATSIIAKKTKEELRKI